MQVFPRVVLKTIFCFIFDGVLTLENEGVI